MDTLLKYIFYIAMIFVVYLVIAGFYQGRLDKNSTVSEVGTEVSDSAKEIIFNTADKVEEKVDNTANSNGNTSAGK